MLSIEIAREEDGRWIGAVPELAGVLAYGATENEARAKTMALALRVIADRVEHNEPVPFNPRDLFAPAACLAGHQGGPGIAGAVSYRLSERPPRFDDKIATILCV